MDGFSPAGLTSLTLALQHRAFAAADELAQHDEAPEFRDGMRPLAATVEQLGQHATDLHQALEARPVISQRLQPFLNHYLSACDPALAGMTKQLMRIQPERSWDVNWQFVTAHVTLLGKYSDLFAYLEEMLRVEDQAGQDASLDAPQGRFMTEQVDRATQTAASAKSILLSGDGEAPSGKGAPAYSRSDAVDSSKAAMLDADAPPPYEPAAAPAPLPQPTPPQTTPRDSAPPPAIIQQPPTPDAGIQRPHLSLAGQSDAGSSAAGSSRASSSQAGPSQSGPSSPNSAWDMSSLTSLTRSFKALTSGLRSKPDPLVSALCQATTNGDVQQVVGLLKHGANINGRDENGDSPLHCAIRADQGQAAEYLLNSGAEVTSGGWSKMPPLYLAASLGSIEVARAILLKGARVDQRSTSGQPFFVEVVSSGNLAGVEFLLQNGANPNVSSISGRPVIVLAAKKHNLEMVELLIGFGAKVNVTDMTGSSLLAIAADKNDPALTDVLLNHGADPNSRTVNGTTVLTEAVNKGKADFALKLLQRGADPNARDLYAQGVIISAVKDIKAPAHLKLDLVRSLLQHGADVNATDGVWATPCVWLAVDTGSLELIEILLQHGALTTPQREDATLLLYAIDKDEVKLARVLLQAGADPDQGDKRGRTPLMQALVKQNAEVVKLLVHHGANVDIAGKAAPAELAKAFGNPEMLEALGLPAGALPLSVTEGRGRKSSLGKLVKQHSLS